mgnify:CR=1 FL=1
MSGKGGSRPTVSKRAKTADQKAAVALRSLATRADELADRLEYGTELPPSELTGVFAELRVLADRDWSEHPCGATFELANVWTSASESTQCCLWTVCALRRRLRCPCISV